MSGFKPYPAYKDSGVKWLSDVPQHWDVRRNKQVFRLVSAQVGKKSADFQLLSLTLRGVIPRDMESGKGKFPAEFDSYQVVEPSDIVFCLFDIDETPRTVGISSDFGMITGAYKVAKTLPVADPRFIYYYYLSIDLCKGLRPFYTGLRKVVRPETFMNIELPLPPLSEQAKICNFLDHETARIDSLIEEQQRMIELLKEKRQAVISHAVTKGLDPTVSMKDSGVDWLGEVPEHWQIKALKYISFCLDGKRIPLNGEERADKQGDVPYWGANAVMDYVDEAIFDEELLLVGEDGAPFLDPLKPVAFHSSGPIWPNNHIHVLRPNRPELVRFLVYAMNSADHANYIEGSTRQKLNQSRLMGMPVSWPSYEEQTQIVQFLDHETARIDALINDQQQMITLLKEKRIALISAAVTGKIDVRNT